MVKLNLGCGIYCASDWINVDKFFTEDELKNHLGGCKNAIFEDGATFVQADILKLPFPDNYADHAEAHEVLEHLGIHEIIPALVEIRRVLKPGAKLLASAPSFDGLMLDWLNLLTWPDFDPKRWFQVAETIYGNQAHEGESHKIPLNVNSMNWIIVQAGFTKGFIGLHRAGSKATKFEDKFQLKVHKSFIKYPENKRVLRNDTLYIEVEK
jgi:predicted SAM-dependent methyltransferase